MDRPPLASLRNTEIQNIYLHACTEHFNDAGIGHCLRERVEEETRLMVISERGGQVPNTDNHVGR